MAAGIHWVALLDCPAAGLEVATRCCWQRCCCCCCCCRVLGAAASTAIAFETHVRTPAGRSGTAASRSGAGTAASGVAGLKDVGDAANRRRAGLGACGGTGDRAGGGLEVAAVEVHPQRAGVGRLDCGRARKVLAVVEWRGRRGADPAVPVKALRLAVGDARRSFCCTPLYL